MKIKMNFDDYTHKKNYIDNLITILDIEIDYDINDDDLQSIIDEYYM